MSPLGSGWCVRRDQSERGPQGLCLAGGTGPRAACTVVLVLILPSYSPQVQGLPSHLLLRTLKSMLETSLCSGSSSCRILPSCEALVQAGVGREALLSGCPRASWAWGRAVPPPHTTASIPPGHPRVHIAVGAECWGQVLVGPILGATRVCPVLEVCRGSHANMLKYNFHGCVFLNGGKNFLAK